MVKIFTLSATAQRQLEDLKHSFAGSVAPQPAPRKPIELDVPAPRP